MKAVKNFHRTLGLVIVPVLMLCLVLTPGPTRAQESDDSAAPQFSHEELTQMLAPIALYPDALLSQILMAATYPIEVIEADRWVRRNPGLKGDSLDAALSDQDWDPSVKAICHFPSILALMSERISETTSLGDAFLAQEGEVMDVVQELRAQAYARGNLTTNSEQRVVLENQTIIIEPVNPRVIYVPYYDPLSIYGPWWYPAYPPYYWAPAGIRIGFGISYWPSVYFSFTFGGWSHFDWHRHYVYVDVHKRPRFVRHDRWLVKSGPWRHAPSHRRGVAYRDRHTARKFGQQPPRSKEIGHNVRGLPGHQVQNRDRRSNARPVVDRNRSRVDRRVIDRSRQERQQAVRQRLQREKTARDHGEQQRIVRDRQDRQQSARQRQQREATARKVQGQQRIDRNRQDRQQLANRGEQRSRMTVGGRQGQQQVLRNRQDRQRTVGQKQARLPADRTGRQVRRVAGEQRQRRPDKVRTTENGKRGGGSRKVQNDDSRDRGRSGGNDRGHSGR